MTTRDRRGTSPAVGLFLVAAAYFVLIELHRPSVPAHDVYAYFLPNILHGADAVSRGGRGLLWNPYQSCGEPFFANPVAGLLYPPHLLFLVLDPNVAVHVVLVVDMVIGATGMLLLAREMGLGRVAAVGGALAFELGDPMAQLASWSPMHAGPWTWVPWAILCCERLLRAPTRRGVAALAVVLALQVLPGFVLIAAVTYQLIVLRVAWDLLVRRGDRPWRAALAIGAALALAPLLVAVQLSPAIEFAAQSYRTELAGGSFLTRNSMSATQLITAMGSRMPPVPLMVVVILVAALAPLASGMWRPTAFYLGVGTLYGALALGDLTPLLRWYVALPPGMATLRYPYRLFWVTGFSLTMLAMIGLDGALRRIESWPRRWARPIVVAGGAVVLGAVAPGGLRPAEVAALAVIVVALAIAAGRPPPGRAVAWVLVAAVAGSLLAEPLRWLGRLMPSAQPLWRHADTFAALRPPLTAQDRVFIIPGLAQSMQHTLTQKTATVLRVRDFYDYEALLGRRHAEYWLATWWGTTFGSLDDFVAAPTAPALRRRLLDLAAVRYLISSSTDASAGQLGLHDVPTNAADLTAHLNDTALPRARWVPRIEVIAEPRQLLARLVNGADDLAEVAFVEAPMPSGFTGAAGPAGTARFVVDDPERLVIDVDAPTRGFLVVADAFYPGWHAAVNGDAVPIHRANYMFRLIEVPAGSVRVELRYRPASVALGAALSAMTLVALAVLVRPRRS